MESYSVNFTLLHFIAFYLFIYLYKSYLTKFSVAHTTERPTDRRLWNVDKQVPE